MVYVMRTNGDGLDPDALLEVCVGGVIGVLWLKDLLPAEGVDKGGSSCQAHQSIALQCALDGALTYQYPRLRRPSGRTGYPS